MASLRGPGGIENLLFPSPRQLYLRRKAAQLGTTTAISATLPRPQESTSQIAQAGAGPRWEEKGSPALSRQRRPPVNVSDVLRDSSGAWWLGRRAKLWPWDSGRSGSVSRGAVSRPALGPQPRSRFLSSQNFIPLSGVTCFTLINLRNLPERSGNARPHPPTEEAGGGAERRTGDHPGCCPDQRQGWGADHPYLPPRGPAAPSAPLQWSSETPPSPPLLDSHPVFSTLVAPTTTPISSSVK